MYCVHSNFTGKAYEGLVYSAAGDKYMQPKVIKDMKFVGHCLSSITNFTREFTNILKVLEILTSDEEKKDMAEGFLTKLTSIKFRSSLCLLQDLLTLLSYFSKMFQKDQCTLADYYNSKEKLVHILENLKLKLQLDPLTSKSLPNYNNLLNMETSEIVVIPPTHGTRSQTRVATSIIGNNLIKNHQDFLQSLTKSVKERFSDTFINQHQEIRAAAILLNDLCESFIDNVDKLVFCGICGGVYKSSSLRMHHQKIHEGKSLIEQCFSLSSFQTEKGPPFFHDLKKMLDSDVTEDVLHKEYNTFKTIFQIAEQEVAAKNIPLSLCTIIKHVYSDRNVQNIPKNIRELVLRIVTISTSEAICESYGSKMEDYHRRFTNSDIDDEQVQTEMFVNELGPPIGKCVNFVQKCLDKHGKNFTLTNEKSRFIGRGKVLDRKLKENYVYPFKF